LDKVQPFGYTPGNFAGAEALHKEAERLYLAKGPKAGQKISLSIQLRADIDEIHQFYMLYVKLLRRELKNEPGLLQELQLIGDRDFSISGKIKQSKGFYLNCRDNQKVGAVVTKYGLTTEQLQAHLDKIEVIEGDKTVQAVMVKEAEKTTEDRNKVFRQLNDWWQNYKLVLIFVFKDDPQQLEAFKIKGYSEGYKPKRKEKTPEGEEPDPEQPGTGQETQDTQEPEIPMLTETVDTGSG
jgi:hypothetical protein